MALAVFRKTYVKLAVSLVVYGGLIYTIHNRVYANRGVLTVNGILHYDNNASEVISTSSAPTSYRDIPDFDDTTDQPIKTWTGDPTQVVIHSYQRCGSSFLGDMFNHNPHVFYQFEPLDALYSHLYGTEFGWNVPSDIYYHGNGSRRVISDADTASVVEHLLHLMNCSTELLPTDTLVHQYQLNIPQEFRSTRRYIDCMRPIVITDPKRKRRCSREFINEYCGKKYGYGNVRRQKTCRELSTDLNNFNNTEPVPKFVRRVFQSHDRCMKDLRSALDNSCTGKWTSACRSKPIRATKVVRANMKIMEKLLESEPNLYVIHLLRDPRGVALSRINLHDSVRGYFSNSVKRNKNEMIAREALLYCTIAVEDVLARKDLEKKYPGRILSIIYDDFVTDVHSYISKTYTFINRTLDSETYDLIIERLSQNTDKRKKEVNTVKRPNRFGRKPRYVRPLRNRNVISTLHVATNSTSGSTLPPSVDIATKWRQQLPKGVGERILHDCREFYDTVKFDWKV